MAIRDFLTVRTRRVYVLRRLTAVEDLGPKGLGQTLTPDLRH